MNGHCIIRNKDGVVLANAPADKTCQIEGYWYFHPDYVDQSWFETSDRIYDCPVKGSCLWVDLKIGKGFSNNAGWIYTQTLPAYDHINGWYGFYDKHKHYTHQECDS
ncbi:MAG: DUF427 domain-containing protein [Proteobacteria bacterium]|nr:DUF427 domain-containing protein [Pseudomonadota bacterium]